MTTGTHRKVLMADDDEEDCFLAKEAFSESGAKGIFSCVEDGVKLMDYLSGRSCSEQDGLPDLILLDLNMPRKDGREALLEIKSNQFLMRIPVVILTTSETEQDIEFGMKSGAESYLMKPATFDGWIEMMKSLAERWL
jgi:CheY-like chemotaxis protein